MLFLTRSDIDACMHTQNYFNGKFYYMKLLIAWNKKYYDKTCKLFVQLQIINTKSLKCTNC